MYVCVYIYIYIYIYTYTYVGGQVANVTDDRAGLRLRPDRPLPRGAQLLRLPALATDV